LGDIVDCCRYLDCIELADDNSDNVSALIEHRPAAVARLNRRRNWRYLVSSPKPVIAETLPTVKFPLVESNPTK